MKQILKIEFIVSSQGLDANAEIKGTSVYVYAKRAKQIGAGFSLDELSKQYEQKSSDLASEELKLTVPGTDPYDRAINSKIFLIKDEVVFLKKVLQIVKDLRS